MYIDAHCHLADSRFEQVEAVLERARRVGVEGWLQGGVGPEDWERQLRLNARYPRLYPVLGLHPCWVNSHSRDEAVSALGLLEEKLSRAVALGELGLDFFKPLNESQKELQTFIFRTQLSLADKLALPIVLHVVKAHSEALSILEAAGKKWNGIVHSFSGSTSDLKRYLALGLSPSWSGRVQRSKSENLLKAIGELPAENMVIETDAPDGGFGKWSAKNEPAALIDVAEFVAGMRKESSKDLLLQSRRNLKRIFGV